MVCRYSAAGIVDGDFTTVVARHHGNLDLPVVGSEPQCIIDQVAYCPTKQRRLGVNVALAAASDSDMSIFCDRLVIGSDFFDRGAPIKNRCSYLFIRRFGSRQKEQVIDDSGEPFAFADRGFDHFAIFLGGAITR